MSSGDPRKRVLALVVLISPIVLVKLAGAWLGGPGPREAAAGVSQEPEAQGLPMPALSARRAPDPERERVAAYIRTLRSQPFGPSPFYYETRPVAAPIAVPVETELPQTTPALDVTIGAIMAMRDGAIALINGQPHRVGDAVLGGARPGWRVTAVDSIARNVTFEHESGDVEVRSVR